jgi:D-alanyl-lipoteichoic acid acyltransferase DltB (MBOAT superfamily)
MLFVSWLIALGTAIWFALLARRAGRNWVLWAFAGWLFALGGATIVVGVIHAAFIPTSHAEHIRFRVESIAAALFLVIVLGWLLTSNLHQQHHSLWKAVKARFLSRPPTAENRRPVQPSPPGKQPAA